MNVMRNRDGNHDHDNERDGDRTVETQNLASLQRPQPPAPKNKFGPQSKNLASIIRGFKIRAITDARLINPGFAYQFNTITHHSG
jgi:hypothetical protein